MLLRGPTSAAAAAAGDGILRSGDTHIQLQVLAQLQGRNFAWLRGLNMSVLS
jgi:hypothetical protein